MESQIRISLDDLSGEGVIGLLREHLADMYATSPPESVHALDVEGLKHPSITFWAASVNEQVLGCVALKEHNAQHAEIKSMRTTAAARNKGVASALLTHLLKEAVGRGYTRLSLETGSMDFFKPARTLYEKNGFSYCGPFADYKDDPNSLFMTRLLS